MNWTRYIDDIEPSEEDLDKLFKVKVRSVVAGLKYETIAMWNGLCFMEREDDDDEYSWVGPIRTVTHYRKI